MLGLLLRRLLLLFFNMVNQLGLCKGSAIMGSVVSLVTYNLSLFYLGDISIWKQYSPQWKCNSWSICIYHYRGWQLFGMFLVGQPTTRWKHNSKSWLENWNCCQGLGLSCKEGQDWGTILKFSISLELEILSSILYISTFLFIWLCMHHMSPCRVLNFTWRDLKLQWKPSMIICSSSSTGLCLFQNQSL